VSMRLIWRRLWCNRALTCMCGTVIAHFTFCKLRCHYPRAGPGRTRFLWDMPPDRRAEAQDAFCGPPVLCGAWRAIRRSPSTASLVAPAAVGALADSYELRSVLPIGFPAQLFGKQSVVTP